MYHQGDAEYAAMKYCARTYGVRHEILGGDQLRKRYPMLMLDDRYGAIYETNAGILFAQVALESFQVWILRNNSKRVVATLRRKWPFECDFVQQILSQKLEFSSGQQ